MKNLLGHILYLTLIGIFVIIGLYSFGQVMILMQLPYVHESFTLSLDLGNFYLVTALACMFAAAGTFMVYFNRLMAEPLPAKDHTVNMLIFTNPAPGQVNSKWYTFAELLKNEEDARAKWQAAMLHMVNTWDPDRIQKTQSAWTLYQAAQHARMQHQAGVQQLKPSERLAPAVLDLLVDGDDSCLVGTSLISRIPQPSEHCGQCDLVPPGCQAAQYRKACGGKAVIHDLSAQHRY